MRTFLILSVALLFTVRASLAAQNATISAPEVKPPISQASPQTPKVEAPKEAEKPVDNKDSANAHPKGEQDAASGSIGTHEQKCCKDAQEHGEEGSEFWPPLYGYRVKVTDTALIAFTGLLFLATLALWWSTRDLVKGHEKTAERQLRAYIGFKSADMTVEYKAGSPLFTASIKLTNFGQTPAHKISARGDIENAIDFKFIKNKEPAVFLENMTLNPGQHFMLRIFMKEWNTPPGSEKFETFVFGKISYFDVFGEERFANFRYRGRYIKGESKYGLSPCNEGNDAD